MLEKQSPVFTPEFLPVFERQLSVGWAGADLGSSAQHCRPWQQQQNCSRVTQLSCVSSARGWEQSVQSCCSGTCNLLEGKCWKTSTALCSHCYVTLRWFIALSFRSQCRWEPLLTCGMGMQDIFFLSFVQSFSLWAAHLIESKRTRSEWQGSKLTVQ